MAASILDITKNWANGTAVKEDNWDEIRDKMNAWALDTRNNLYQLARDSYGMDYNFNNLGNVTAYQGNLYNPNDILNLPIDSSPIGVDNDCLGVFTSITYNPPKTDYLVINAKDFIPDDPSTNIGSWLLDPTNGGYLQNGDPAFGSLKFNAPVFLPHGAVVTEFKVYYKKYPPAAAVTGMIFYMYRETMSDGTIEAMEHFTAANSSGTIVSERGIPIHPTIDNSTYCYFVEVTIDNVGSITDCYFLSIVLEYTVTEPLP